MEHLAVVRVLQREADLHEPVEHLVLLERRPAAAWRRSAKPGLPPSAKSITMQSRPSSSARARDADDIRGRRSFRSARAMLCASSFSFSKMIRRASRSARTRRESAFDRTGHACRPALADHAVAALGAARAISSAARGRVVGHGLRMAQSYSRNGGERALRAAPVASRPGPRPRISRAAVPRATASAPPIPPIEDGLQQSLRLELGNDPAQIRCAACRFARQSARTTTQGVRRSRVPKRAAVQSSEPGLAGGVAVIAAGSSYADRANGVRDESPWPWPRAEGPLGGPDGSFRAAAALLPGGRHAARTSVGGCGGQRRRFASGEREAQPPCRAASHPGTRPAEQSVAASPGGRAPAGATTLAAFEPGLCGGSCVIRASRSGRPLRARPGGVGRCARGSEDGRAGGQHYQSRTGALPKHPQ